jgi:poly-gamma-glutamate synthesis protein (capsule biosynthesis protein)
MDSLKTHITTGQSFTIQAVGDVLAHKPLFEFFKTDGGYDFSPLLKRYKVNPDNLNYYNQESIIGGKKLGVYGSFEKVENLTPQPHFNSPEEFGDFMIDKGFNLVSLANNHVLDMDGKGVVNSLRYWKTKDVISAGQYKNEKYRFTTHTHEKNGITYAFFSYTQKINCKYNDPEHPYFRNDYDPDLVKRDIESVRDKVDVVIVAIHWGSEHTFTPNEKQRETAQYLADLGVDIIIGHHSHCVQTVDRIGKTLVIYSLGNFIACQDTTSVSTRIGLEMTIKVSKSKRGITILPQGRLTYLYSTEDNKDFSIRYLDTIPKNLLPNRDILLKEYWRSVTRYYKIPYKNFKKA